MQEPRMKRHPILERFTFLISSVVSTVLLIVSIWGIIAVRQLVPLVGIVILFAVPLVTIAGVSFLVFKVVSHALEWKESEIGPNGQLLQRFGKITQIHPLGLREYSAKSIEKAKENEKIEVPSVLELLRTGFIGGADLLLGFHLDGTPHYGLWEDLRTFVIAGKSRSGKSVTMVFIILQALLAGARVYLCDPHYRKKDGLLKVLEAVTPFMRIARTSEEILALAKEFTEEMQAREQGISEDKTPCIFVCDEWSKLLRDLAPFEVDQMVEVFLNCAEAWAGFSGFAMIAGHEWTARESGGRRGAALRKNTHAAIVHRLDADYAKFLLQGSKGKKAASQAPNLPRGHAHLQDAEGELSYLIMPYYGKNFEAVIEVSQMLVSYPENAGIVSEAREQLPEATYTGVLPPVHTPGNSKQAVYQEANTDMEPLEAVDTDGYQSGNTALVPFEPEKVKTLEGVNINEKLTDVQVKALILRMVKRNIPLRDVAYTVSLYGRNYDAFKALCIELNVKVPENA